MARKNENMETDNRLPDTGTNATTDLAIIGTSELENMFGDKVNVPAILMYDEKKAVSVSQIINIASGENVSLSNVINKELTLEGFGAVRLEYPNAETGEVVDYIRYILITDSGMFTTTSAFIGRTLKMLYQTMVKSPKVRFVQQELGDGKRRFRMEIL